jgi:Ca2+/Na+ antiporter
MSTILLVITSFLMVDPVIKNIIVQEDKIIFAAECMFLFTFFISILFWAKPIKNGTLHKFDGIFAKVSICIASLLILLYMNTSYCDKLIYLICFFMMSTIFSLSNSCSRRAWCSTNHIINHFIFHLIILFTLDNFLC